MILSFQNIFTTGGKRETIRAEISTNHPESRSGQPVILLEDGDTLDEVSWVALDYKVEEASIEEEVYLRAIGWA